MVDAVGIPKPTYPIRSSDLMAVEKARVAFLTGRDILDHGAGKWNAQQRQYFLRIMKEPLDSGQMRTIETALKLTGSSNSEVDFEWFLLCIRNGHEDIRPRLEAFLSKVGRRKFVLPLYREMFQREIWKPWAIPLYERNRGSYHSITSGAVDRLVDN